MSKRNLLIAAKLTMAATISTASLGVSAAMDAQARFNPAVAGRADISCMARIAPDGRSVPIVLLETGEAVMSDKGFRLVECKDAFPTQRALLDYRDAICRVASLASGGTVQVYTVTLGESPAVLCGMAEAALGPWKRERGE